MAKLRHPSRLECSDPTLFPPELRDWGFPYLDREWTWVIEVDSTPIALVICSFAGGMLVIWRILSTSSAKRVESTWFWASLPKILDNARLRGCVAYLSMFDDAHESETQLARILTRAGGVLKPFKGMLGVGPIPGVNDASVGTNTAA